jgi:replicative DNA helicase
MSEPDLRRQRRQAPAVDRLPPHSIEAEQSALGCILIDETRSAEGVSLVIEKLGRNATEAFFDMRHRSIWMAMEELVNAGVKLYVVTLANYLKDKQLLEQVGGMSYIGQLPDLAPTADALETFLDVMLEHYRRRKMIVACTEAVSRLYDEPDTSNALDLVERDIMDVRQIGAAQQLRPIRQVVHESMDRIEEFLTRAGALIGLGTGFQDLDKLTGGLVPGEYYILAARPSMGKTSLAMNIVEHVTIDQQLPVGVFSLEMTVDSLVLRMLCSRARVSLRNIRDGFMAQNDFPKLTGAAGKIAASHLFVDDVSGLSIMELRARARRMVIQHDIKLLVVDYIQLLSASINGKRPDNREREVSEISAGLKALCKELRIPVIALSQLKRGIDGRKGMPQLADLRESGSLEQDADTVMLLSRKEGSEDQVDGNVVPIALDVAKQRNGPTGKIGLTFWKSVTRFEATAKISDEDVPEQEHLDYRRHND